MKAVAPSRPGRRRAALSTDLVVACGLLTAAALPLSTGFLGGQRLLRDAHHHAAAMELVDGEAEVLAAGELLRHPEGRGEYRPAGGTVTNLPSGRFLLRRQGRTGRLEWIPDRPVHGGAVVREFRVGTETEGLR